MKSVSLPLAFFSVAFSALAALANATPVSARYFRFEGYATTATGVNTGRIRLYEIEAFANGVNVARTAAVTVNSASTIQSYLNDGSLSTEFKSSNTNPGPPSEASPHRIQMDFGSAVPIDRTNVYVVGGDLISFGLFLSNDGVSWTQYGRYNQAGGTIQSDPSAPFVVIQSAAMRPGTTFMDVVYRVSDPDNATVKTRALAFVDGLRSFAKVLKPVTFVEGTAANLGNAIPINVNHTLTWDVGADWDIDLGQVKFEVLAMDGGLLPFGWITIPAAGGNPALTISKDAPSDDDVLNALFWQYADGDTGLSLVNGVLRGTPTNGNFSGLDLASGTMIYLYGPPFIFKRMNLDPTDSSETNYAAGPPRAGLLNTARWHAARRPYGGVSIVVGWGNNGSGQTTIPVGLSGFTAIASGYSHSLALNSDGTVISWGITGYPAGLSGFTAIAASEHHSLALKSDGTVLGWGQFYISPNFVPVVIPAGLSGVTAIAAGRNHDLALKNDGTVVGWGDNYFGQITIPAGLSGITAISAGREHSLALKSDGTVVGWGLNGAGQIDIPAGLSGVTAISAGEYHSLALKSDGTVIGWGEYGFGQITIPAGLSGVTAIAAGGSHSLALKSDGTVVGWGDNSYGQITIPSGLSGVTAISAGREHSLTLKAKAP